jgi:hypothetical protein
MPAVGRDSGSRYLEDEILKPSCFEQMKGEVLHLLGQPESVVVPVRKNSKPHFRILSNQSQARRVGGVEDNDPTHQKVIKYLVERLNERKKLRISTYVFGGEDREEQTIFTTPKGADLQAPQPTDYKWWTEARIQLDSVRYIQPDICGRSNSAFLPLKSEKAVIIEVIQSHYPDEETFHALTTLSKQNFIVLFFFVAKDGWGSAYSSFDMGDLSTVGIRCAYWLSNGEFFRNGECVSRDNKTDEAWYLHLATRFFDSARKKKDE